MTTTTDPTQALRSRCRDLHAGRREVRAALEVGILEVRAGKTTGADALLDVLGVLLSRGAA